MTLWSSTIAQALHFQAWEEEGLAVVFNANSGDTHLVEEFALQLLKLTGPTGASTLALKQELMHCFAEDDSDKITEFINATLLQLQDAGLVHRIAL